MWGGECAHKPSLKHIYLLISSCNTDCTHIVHVLFLKSETQKLAIGLIFDNTFVTQSLLQKCTSSSSSSFLFVRYFDLMIITCYFYFLFILIFWGQILLLSFFMNGSKLLFLLNVLFMSLSWFKIVVFHFCQHWWYCNLKRTWLTRLGLSSHIV